MHNPYNEVDYYTEFVMLSSVFIGLSDIFVNCSGAEISQLYETEWESKVGLSKGLLD